MRFSVTLLFSILLVSDVQAQTADIAATYRAAADRLIDAALADSTGFRRLTEVTDRYGPRLSGSDNLERAIDWIVAHMRRDGLDNVRKEPVMVPHWVRGNESLEMITPLHRKLPVLGLGGSVGTPAGGINAEVLVVRSFEELAQRANEAKERIVVFNAPFTTY